MARFVRAAVAVSIVAGTLPVGARPAVAVVPAPGPVVAVGGSHVCVVRSSLFVGAAACWGQNSAGQLGDGTTSNRLTPVAVDTSGVLGGVTLTQIAAGQAFTCALSSAGRAYCWGDNSQGGLGDGTFIDSHVPVAVDTSGVLNGVVLDRISVGYNHACALSTTGHLYCWGYDLKGQLGDGTTANQNLPVAIDPGSTYTEVAAQYNSTCVLSPAGRVSCTGENNLGVLGDGTLIDASTLTPTSVSGVLSGVTAAHVALGPTSACALSTTGVAYCWGDNWAGQVGDGTTTNRTVPVAVDASGVLSGIDLAQIAIGNAHTCAASATGVAYCWGSNDYSQLGDGTSTGRHTAGAVDASGVLAGKVVVRLSSSNNSTCATTLLHGVYCWGYNGDGEMADGTTTDRDHPVEVVPEDTMPDSPTNIHVTPENGSATVAWTVPGALGNGTLTGYTVTAQPGGHTCTTTGTSCTVTGLSGGTRYTFSVTASTTVGTSDPSAPATATPTGLATTGHDIGSWLATGLGLLAAGTVLVLLARRPRRRRLPDCGHDRHRPDASHAAASGLRS